MAIEMIRDPREKIMERAAEIRRNVEAAQNGTPPMDPKELAEREEAAQAYLGEDEKFFVDYLADCIKTSTDAMKDIREIQDHCYRVYKENEPAVYNRKADWQSRIVIPKPFGTVQYGASAVKKAFTPKFLTVTNTKDKWPGNSGRRSWRSSSTSSTRISRSGSPTRRRWGSRSGPPWR